MSISTTFTGTPCGNGKVPSEEKLREKTEGTLRSLLDELSGRRESACLAPVEVRCGKVFAEITLAENAEPGVSDARAALAGLRQRMGKIADRLARAHEPLVSERKLVKGGRRRTSPLDLPGYYETIWKLDMLKPSTTAVTVPVAYPESLTASLPRGSQAAIPKVIREAVEDARPFSEDRERLIDGLDSRVGGGGAAITLKKEGPIADPVSVADAFLRFAGSRRRPGSAASAEWAAIASASLLVISIALSFFVLAGWSILLLLGLTLAGLFVVPTIGPRVLRRFSAARLLPTLVGMGPVLVFLGFAVVYAFLMEYSESITIHPGFRSPDHIRDPLLLSVTALTGGTLDFSLELSGPVRSIVYAEMLLFIGTVGYALVQAAQWTWGRFNEALEQGREPPSR